MLCIDNKEQKKRKQAFRVKPHVQYTLQFCFGYGPLGNTVTLLLWPLFLAPGKTQDIFLQKKTLLILSPVNTAHFLAHCWLETVLTRLYCSCNLPCFYWCTCFPKIQCTCINAKQLSVSALHFDSKVANKHYQHSITQSKPPFHVNNVTYVKK